MDSDLLRTINWKTTGFAIGYVACQIVGWVYPGASQYCQVIETVAVAGGFATAADSSRVHNIVQAVDGILGINKVTPSSIVTETKVG